MKRIITLMLILIISIFSLSSCTSKVSYIDDETDEEPLRLYLFTHNYMRKHYVEYYNRMKVKDKRRIDIIIFPNDEIESMYKQLLNEISMGKGPDLIYIDDQTNKYIDVSKMSKSNAFADMDILIENDGEFDFSQYNKMALDTGIVDGKRILMPISYKVDYIMGPKESFENNGLEIPDKLTMDTYLDLIEEYYMKRPNMPAMLGIEPVNLLSEYIKIGEPIKKSSELQRLFEVLKEEDKRLNNVSQSFIDDISNYADYDNWIEYYCMFVENNFLFKKSNIAYREEFFLFFEHYNIFNHNGGNLLLFEQPFSDDSPTKAYTEEFFAININSKHKNEAFDFVKFMMSEETNFNRQVSSYLPISKAGYEFIKNDLMDGYHYFESGGPIPNEVKIPQKTADKLVNYVESAGTCEYIGNLRYIYHNIMNQSIKDYYNDRLTFDEMMDEINNKLSIYYSE